jgi:probable HAF family extracellular repeat protein
MKTNRVWKSILTVAVTVTLRWNTFGQTNNSPDTQKYIVTDLGTLFGWNSYAYSINNRDQVVGSSIANSGYTRAVLYENGTVRDLGLGTNGAYSANARAINDAGQITGYLGINTSSHIFLYENGLLRDIGSGLFGNAGYTQNYGYGINASGNIVGYNYYNGGNPHACFISNNVSKTMPGISSAPVSFASDINNSNHIVGDALLPGQSSRHAYLYADGSVKDLGTLGGTAGSYSSYATAINNNEQIVGASLTTSNVARHAFIYSNNHMTDLGALTGAGGESVAYAINDRGVAVGYSMTTNNVQHACVYTDGSVRDLNGLVINQNSGWTLQTAWSINNAGKIVGVEVNSSGASHAFLLTPIPTGSLFILSNTIAIQPSYGTIEKQPGKENLILITHGWINPLEQLYPGAIHAVDWVDTMSNAVSQYLTSQNITGWQIAGYKWTEGASTLLPDSALSHAKQEGRALGNMLDGQGWQHIHLIAHSAGAGLIDSITRTIRENSPNTGPTIQCTFLDPYLGIDLSGKQTYGLGSSWSDQYYTRDQLTGTDVLPFTALPLEHAHNVDVTELDIQHKTKIDRFISGNIQSCYTTRSTHGWPIDFYMNTITGTQVTGNYAQYGFNLSFENMPGWGAIYILMHYYPVGNGVVDGEVVHLGNTNPACFADIIPTTNTHYHQLDMNQLPQVRSSTGTIIKDQQGNITLKSGSPVWIGTCVTETNAVNTVSFDANFQSTPGSEGILSVIWDTNTIGTLDERVSGTGLRQYSYTFTHTLTNSVHMLGFRLDPFTQTQSIVTLSNIRTIAQGATEPPTLTITTNSIDGLRVLRLTGQPGFEYTIQTASSINSTHWVDIISLQNTNGIVDFFDHTSTNNQPSRFYRAVVGQ